MSGCPCPHHPTGCYGHPHSCGCAQSAMTDAREIIAHHLCEMAAQGWYGISPFERAAYRTTAQGMVGAIEAAGSRILGPDEVDQVTEALERALVLLESSLLDKTSTSREWHRKDVVKFIASVRSIGRKT